jgi:hypothetical protein
MRRYKPRKYKKIMKYDVYCIGVTKKLEKKTQMEAYSAEEAERKAERFAKMAGLKFSHIQVENE